MSVPEVVFVPDRWGFDHLPDNGHSVLRCITCGEAGPPWKWPQLRREQHFRAHANGGAVADAERRLADALAERERAARRQAHAERRRILAPRECGNPYCSVIFQPVRRTARYCSPRCRVAAHRAKAPHK
jgi:hypothetical protein